jgi:hypothetical protein
MFCFAATLGISRGAGPDRQIQPRHSKYVVDALLVCSLHVLIDPNPERRTNLAD